jgi:eukaryotic-like serine/threonine-protein kinase
MLSAVWVPIARASAALRQNDPTKAITLLEGARSYELGIGPVACGYWPIYVRGQAYLQAHDGAHASGEYQRILDRHGVDPTHPLYVLAQLELARAYALQGDSVKARTSCQDFFAALKER